MAVHAEITVAKDAATLRLDPFALPLRYSVPDASADGRLRTLDLFRERVIIRRTVAGARMKYQVPTKAYSGVMLRLMPPTDTEAAYALVMLAHSDPGLIVPLFVSTDANEAVVECHTWARVMNLPVMLMGFDGSMETLPAAITLQKGHTRRKRYGSAYLSRRPLQRFRRKVGSSTPRPVLRHEHEIIARN